MDNLDGSGQQPNQPTLCLVQPPTSGGQQEQTSMTPQDNEVRSSIPTTAATTDHDDNESEDHDVDDGKTSDEISGSGVDEAQAKKKDFKPRCNKGLVEKAKNRTTVAKRRGNSLITAAKAFLERTGGDVFVKAKYTSEGGRGKHYTFGFGKDFKMPSEESTAAGEPTSPVVVDTEAVKTAVEEGFRGALDKLEKSSPVQGASGMPTSQNLFGSPSGPSPSAAPRRRHVSSAGCIVCTQDDINIDVKGQTVEADWFYCSKIGCRAKAHNECVGFPGAKYAIIGAVAKWYCRLHVGQGRLLPAGFDEVSLAPVATTPTASSTGPQKKTTGKTNAGGETKKKPGRPKKT